MKLENNAQGITNSIIRKALYVKNATQAASSSKVSRPNSVSNLKRTPVCEWYRLSVDLRMEQQKDLEL